MMKISVIGSGAMGCLFGSLLSVKNDVVIIGRNKNTVDFINNHGITINSSEKFYPKAALNGSYYEKSDLAVIMVKSYDTVKALENNKKLIENSQYILTLQNGLGNSENILEFAERDKIFIGTTEHNSSVEKTGYICHGGNGATIIGGLSGSAEKIADVFSECGISAKASNDVFRVIWKKLLLNAAVNAVTAVLGIPTGFIVKNNNVLEICQNLVSESVKTAESCNLSFSSDEIMQSVRNLSLRQPHAFTSMYSDITNNRKTEIDSINGAIVSIAEKNNISVPFNRMITDMIHALEMKGISGI